MVFYFRKGTKKAVTKFVTAFLWTSQGLNLGPPDYESVATRKFFKIVKNMG